VSDSNKSDQEEEDSEVDQLKVSNRQAMLIYGKDKDG